MRIIICDDEKKICDALSEKVCDLFPDAEVTVYTSGSELLDAKELPDILLLDIKMPDMGGMEVARILRDRDWRGILIFVTGEEDKVFDSFDLHAFHFLVKPVSEEKLKSVLEDAKEESDREKRNCAGCEKFIDIQTGTSHIRIRLSRLFYAEVYDRKIILHMKKETIEYYGQLSALQELVGNDFHRIHRSYLVNLRYIERYDRSSVTLTNGDNIPIARRGYDGFLKAYMEYNRRRMGA